MAHRPSATPRLVVMRNRVRPLSVHDYVRRPSCEDSGPARELGIRPLRRKSKGYTASRLALHLSLVYDNIEDVS